MTAELVIAVGWKAPDAKPSPFLILYTGADWIAGAAAVDTALDSNAIAHGLVYRGGFGGQVMYHASLTHRPQQQPAPVLEPTG